MKDPNAFADQIKSQLSAMNKTTAEPTWERVATTLKKNKRRRYATWVLSSLGTFTVLVLFFTQCTGTSTNSLAAPLNNPDSAQEVVTTADSDSSTPLDISEDDPAPIDSTNQANLTNSETVVTTNSSSTKTNAPVRTNNFSEQETLDSVNTFEGAEVKTTYYYYNQANNTQIVTQDKTVIDSILATKEVQKPKDSMQ